MDFALSPEQKAIREEVVAFARAELNAGAAERERDGTFPRELWRRCGALRLQGLMVPAEYGGRGLDAVSATVALEALGYACLDGGLTFAICAHLLACVVPIWKHGSEEQKQRYLPGLSDGTLVAGNAMTEPSSGSDAFSMRTRAEPDNGNGAFRITGNKIFVSNGPVADLFVTYAATAPGKGHDGGITAFVVTRDLPGVRTGQIFHKMGLATSPMGELILDNACVPADAVLGRVAGGAHVFSQSMDWERICLVAAHVGAMERLVETCVAEARRSGARPADRSQAVADLIADMKVRLEAARLLTYRAAARLDRSRDAAMHASMTKLFVSEAFLATAQDALRILGPNAVLARHDAEAVFRDAVAARIYSGTSEIQRTIVARWLGL